MPTPWKESYDQPRQHIQKWRHYFANKGPSGQGYGFSSSHVWMWGLDYKEGWAPKNWCFWSVVLEKTLESPLDCKEVQPVHPKGDQSRVFIGRTDIEAETPILWPSDTKNWLLGKDPDAGKGWGHEEKGMTEDEMVDGITNSMDMVWVDSGSWWWTGRPGMLWFVGSQRVGRDWVTELNWTECRRPWFNSWVGKIHWRRFRLPTPVFLGFPCGSAGKESACNAGNLGSVPELGRYPGEGKGYPLQYSGLENSMDCKVHEVTKSQTPLSNFQFTLFTCPGYCK